MLMYGFYQYWRYAESRRDDESKGAMVLYILAATLYSVYACCWDLLTDWSMLRTHAKYPLLRDEVLCADHLPLYYFAIITNLVIRFSWIMYFPSQGLPFKVRTFIVAMLEMLRRWQWNFLRLENEHLGNIDQYRVTRNIPLPYIFDSSTHDSDIEDWDQPPTKGWVGRIFAL
ncbi:hypothetical protein BDM02DRAFT_2541909 [Thelephora ganbajun]|uniref:Uncharacterized protein n=1 Tax=Thelephora ganbajun TaxID=370292 RepID=A0ACB6ZSP9_THEGA|nr:hypothetical protein BDM02DRAFT_2541909 [Thelephora ganbajun]